MKKLAFASALLASALTFSTSAQATNFSFVGNFITANDVQLFNFNVGSTSTVTLRTWSYAGGTNAAGASIARGGFDPILALFDSNGLLIDQNDDGSCSDVAMDTTGACFDTYLSSTLGAGDYTVAVMAFSNFANGPNLANGFANTGSFIDFTGDPRDTHWAFDVLNVNSAVVTGGVPEPTTWALMVLGMGFAGAAMRRGKPVASRVSVTYA